jgi:hypothetical protein
MHDDGELKAAIAAECDVRGEPTQDEIVEWLLGARSGLVRDALGRLVRETLLARLDDAKTEELLTANPELREREREMRLLAEDLGFKVWFLFGLDGGTLIQCAAANQLLAGLRLAELEARRAMMAGQINEWAEETIRGLEADFGA